MKKIYVLLFMLFYFAFSQAQIVDIPDANFKSALVNDIIADFDGDGVPDGDVDTNDDGEIQVSEAEAVISLEVSQTYSTSLEGLNSFVNLKTFYMNSAYNISSIEINALSQLENLIITGTDLISTLDLSGNPMLKELKLAGIGLTSLDVSQNPNLVWFDASSNDLSEIDVSNNLLLEYLDVSLNLIENLNVSSLANLESLGCNNNTISSLNILGCTSLNRLACFTNQLTELDISENPNLQYLTCYNNQIGSLDFSLNPELIELKASTNQLTTLDFSQNPNLSKLIVDHNNLTSINIKNGDAFDYHWSEAWNTLVFSSNPNLEYICADESEISKIVARLDSSNMNNCTVSSYCTFVPGGEYYSISGNNTLDLENDGCDILDTFYPNLKFEVSNDISIHSLISGNDGSYFLPVLAGNHTITPQFNGSSYFSVSPSSLVVDFPSDTSPVIQDFCIAPNGDYSDLEVYVTPLTEARPGFDANYKITYKNVGSVVLSGDVTMAFNDDLMDLLSSNPAPDSQTTGQLLWNYTDLLPFESRSVFFKMNLNTPTDSEFPLFGDDILNFAAVISPVIGDETEGDNSFQLNQAIVNSYDPNDITCLEGATIELEEVGDFLHYIIRFENTGSASAVNVVVKNKLNSFKLDVDSMIPLEGSHSFYTRRIGYETVEFVFENINLPFDDENNDGYVVFKIKTLTNLQLGDYISNRAEIYFDFNAPIITNTAITTVEENLSIDENDFKSKIKLYPNPVNDNLFVESKNGIESIAFYDINGRLLQNTVLIQNKFETELSLVKLNSGVYFVEIVSKKGKIVKKIIKE
ncbi:T9SS type A sorting domain-containing protein [Winogradskyella sp. SM1960]|uniref:DUF7619 domain-containing protein n=1 Tax=Winogradskyella sp. SM1960 TaxID=2865955 RepID=UPI001CD79D12|nr:T9SS type A sorting domain-containing protein [Winogradskyella sp. SM1960]